MAPKKGFIPWNKGKKGVQVSWCKGLKGDTRSRGGAPKGTKPWNYIDGRSKTQAWNRYGHDWKKVRAAVFIRDNFTCKECGITNTLFHAHHIVPFVLTKNNSLTNLITLCAKCHRLEEIRIMKELKAQR